MNNNLSFNEVYNIKNNAFDITRFLLAIMVIYSHSYPLLYGNDSRGDILTRLTNNQIDFGSFAVVGFFVISGFLITQSLLSSKNYLDYFIKRILRIFPALIASTLLFSLIVGSFLSKLHFSSYYDLNAENNVFAYIISNISLNLLGNHGSVNDVFINNPLPSAINGSVWTLKHEVICYISLAIIAYFNFFKHKLLLIGMTIVTFVVVILNFSTGFVAINSNWWIFNEYKQLVYLFYYFIIGSLIFVFKDKIYRNYPLTYSKQLCYTVFEVIIMTFLELIKKFPTEESCIDYYLKIRYPNGIHCNHCGSSKVYQRTKNLKAFTCNDCYDSFSPFTGTIFEKSSTDLRKWFYAIHLFLNGKKGISGLQLQREIGVTYKTAWRMLQQIRIAMGNASQSEFFDTIVEIDETYVGGKPRKDNEHNDDLPKGTGTGAKRGRGTSKTPVIGIVDRLNKQVYAKIALPNKDGKKLTAKQLMDVLNTVSKAENGNTIMTDEFRGYDPLKRHNFVHLRVDHTKAFSDYNGTHTNNIESFWATLKRGVYGIYHHISVKHMQRYVDEFCFRYNNRGLNMFDMVLRQSLVG